METKRLTRQQELEISLSLTEAIAHVPEPGALFQVLYETLRPVFRFEVSVIILPVEGNPELGEMFVSGISLPRELDELIVKRRLPIANILSGFDVQSPEIHRFNINEVDPSKTGLERDILIIERELHVTSFTLCPLVHGGKVIGHLILGNRQNRRILDREFTFLQNVGKIIAAAVASTTAYTQIRQREKDSKLLLEFTNTLIDTHDVQDFYQRLLQSTQKLRSFCFVSVKGMPHADEEDIILFWDGRTAHTLNDSPLPLLERSGNNRIQMGFWEENRIEELYSFDILRRLQIRNLLQLGLRFEKNIEVVLSIGFNAQQIAEPLPMDLLSQVGIQLYLAFHNLIIWQQVNQLQERLQQENRVLRDEITPAQDQPRMIGSSPNFRRIVQQARLVAPADTTVLLLGETGTGKEVIARFLHENSSRRSHPMVRVNCAALPAQLIESELFGHEKGSFTGAFEKRLGKFELAEGGSIFLDEIGELPLESQAKLLRALQEKEFERVGGHQVLHANVRVIAATNRDLAAEVKRGTFRSDLYFRLCVFELNLPPLRERREDIPVLAETFLQRAAKKLGRTIRPLSQSELEFLENYTWPGNIRELEHVMENAVILARDGNPSLAGLQRATGQMEAPTSESVLPWETMERQHILRALQASKGRIAGEDGAAKMLDLNPKTLESKMRKLGIKRQVAYR